MGLKGIVASTLVAGAVFTGVAYTWDGGSAIDAAKQKIAQLTGSNATFKANEGKLISKANGLKNQIEQLNADKIKLQEQIDKLIAEGGDNTEYIAELQAQITAKNAEITKLTADLEKANADLAASDADGEALGKEIQRLQAELQEANTDAQELQASVNEAGTVAESDQAAVDAALSNEGGTEVTPDPEPTPDPTPDPEPTPQYETINMIGGTPTSLDGSDLVIDKVQNPDGTWELVITNYSGNKTYTVAIDGVEHTIGAGGQYDAGTNVSLDGAHLNVKRGTLLNKDYTLVNK